MTDNKTDEIKTLPETAFELLLKLWARSHNAEIVRVQKFPVGTHKERKEGTVA